jgi:exodeoxyribonuclease V gamma subunit
VAGVHGDLIRTVTYSRLAPNHRLQAWLRLVALTASRPERAFAALTLGRLRALGTPGCTVSAATIEPLGPEAAERQKRASAEVEILVDLYRRGLREALPIYCKTTAAWAQATPARRHQHAAKQWTSEFKISHEDAEPEHQLVLGGVVPFDRLLEDAPRPDEAGTGWDLEETTRFGRYARRLWGGLLEREQVGDE